MELDFTFEQQFMQSQRNSCVGVDEAGRGCLAGPVVAAAVSFPRDHQPIPGINDSKKLSPRSRQDLFARIINQAQYSIHFVSVTHINHHNILQSSLFAMSQALIQLLPFGHAFIDGPYIPSHPQLNPARLTPVKHGDAKIYSIAAASILAKVARDRFMQQLHHLYPHYGWTNNKGYGTLKHRQAIMLYGPSPHHRAKFISRLISSA